MDDNKKLSVTAHELAKIIQLSEYGEYGSDHDRTPSYTLENKLDWVETMLKDWDNTEPDGKKLIVYFIRILVKEAGSSSALVVDRLASYSQIPEVAKVINKV